MVSVSFVLVFVVVVHFSSGFPLTNSAMDDLQSSVSVSNKTSNGIRSRPARSLSSANYIRSTFANPCENDYWDSNEEDVGLECGDLTIRLRQMEIALQQAKEVTSQNGLDLLCDGDEDLTFAVLEPTKVVLKKGSPASSTHAHKATISLHMFSDYLKRSQMRDYEDMYHKVSSHLQGVSCHMQCLNKKALAKYVKKLEKNALTQLASVDEVDDTVFFTYHCAFLENARRTIQNLIEYYED